MELNNYYEILDVSHKFTAFKLLKNFFSKVSIALKINDPEYFAKVSMGFEVLRHESSHVAYNRMYRKYILSEDLNFPEIKESQMLNLIKKKEQEGLSIAQTAINKKETYLTQLGKYILKVIINDLLNVFPFGRSGILFVSVGAWCAINFTNSANLVGGPALILFGTFIFCRNIKNGVLEY